MLRMLGEKRKRLRKRRQVLGKDAARRSRGRGEAKPKNEKVVVAEKLGMSGRERQITGDQLNGLCDELKHMPVDILDLGGCAQIGRSVNANKHTRSPAACRDLCAFTPPATDP